MKGPIPGFRGHLLTTILVAAFAIAWMLFLLREGGGLPALGDPYEVRAVLPTAASLASNARVTMSGVEVGRVKSVQRWGRGAVVELEMNDAAVTPIPADSRIAVRQRTAVGENYVSVEPGRSATDLRSGGILSARQADDYVDLDQILSVLQGPTRQRARELFRGFGGALDGRGEQLNALLEGTARTLTAGASVAHVLSRDRYQLSRLVAQFGDVSRAVGDRGHAIDTFARQALLTFRALAQSDTAVRATLDQLPSTLAQVRSSGKTLSSVTGRAAPVLAELAVAVRGLRPAVELLRPAARQGTGVLRDLGAAAPPLQRTLGRVRGISDPLAAAMPHVYRTLCELNPALRYLKPYVPDVVATYVGLGASMKSYDALGHLMRATPVISEQALVGLPSQVHDAALTLTKAGLLDKTRVLGYDPYPPPGSIGKNPDGDGVLGPAQVKKKFPRIEADC